MSRIPTPPTIEAAPAASQPTLNSVKAAFGSAPNMFRLIANSPAAIDGLWSLWTALGRGELVPATRERIALAVANVNGCSYCNSAHGYIGKHVAKMDDVEIAANRAGRSTDAKADAAVRFAVKLTREEALRLFTIDAAYAAHMESRVGSLEPGKWADFILIDRDYFTVPENEIDDIRVAATYVAGRRVTESGNPAN